MSVVLLFTHGFCVLAPKVILMNIPARYSLATLIAEILFSGLASHYNRSSFFTGSSLFNFCHMTLFADRKI